VLLGFSTLDAYTHKHPFFGATVGRYANRIAEGRFELGGRTYGLARNNGPNSLHGGFKGFDKHVWDAEAYEEKGGVYVRLSLESPDGDEGYPGNLEATVTYGLTGDDSSPADYRPRSTRRPDQPHQPRVLQPERRGQGRHPRHEVLIHASAYLPVGSTLIPTGILAETKGNAFDFRTRKSVGRDLSAAGGGYDHCFAVDGDAGKLRPCAEVFEPTTGRTMKLSTTQPGVQFYTGNFLSDIAGKRGSMYDKHSGFCLETQHFPDSPNRAAFPDCVFGPDRKYHEKAEFSFDW
jgi:aldose 1-epimerase